MNVLLQGTSARARPSSRCTRPSSRSGRATRRRSWLPPRCWPASTSSRWRRSSGSGAIPYLELASSGKGDSAQGSLLEAEPPAEDGPRVAYALLSAAVTGKDRARIVDGIAAGDVDLVVGTHALVQEGWRSPTCPWP